MFAGCRGPMRSKSRKFDFSRLIGRNGSIQGFFKLLLHASVFTWGEKAGGHPYGPAAGTRGVPSDARRNFTGIHLARPPRGLVIKPLTPLSSRRHNELVAVAEEVTDYHWLVNAVRLKASTPTTAVEGVLKGKNGSL